MTSKSLRRLVRCKNEQPRQESRSYHHLQTAGQALPCFKRDANNPCSEFPRTSGRDFENRLLKNENLARRQYVRLLNTLSLEKLPEWFDQMLNQRFFPALNRIGFDRTILEGLFEIASSSWCRMGPEGDKIIGFHPKIDREIEEVRQGLNQKINNSHRFSHFVASTPSFISGTIHENQSPNHIFDLFTEVATPWIVLPRASGFLKKDQCRYLPAYLTTIEREPQEPFSMLFSRITVEFMGNYCLKFATSCHPPNQIAKLLFHAYACLFWKTLRCPPRNLENSAVFDIYLSWLIRLADRSEYLGDAEDRSINCMKTMKKLAFPATAATQFAKINRADSSRFMVTLRHGCFGIAAALKYFGIDQFLKTKQRVGRFQSSSFRNDLHGLLHTIQTGYHLESSQTREYLQRFMDCLRSSVELSEPDCGRTDRNFLIKRLNNIQILLSK